MTQTAKLFMNGRSQAVRLPARYRFDGDEVFIRQDAETGDVILSRKPDSWDDYFELTKKLKIPDDFMSNRDQSSPEDRELF